MQYEVLTENGQMVQCDVLTDSGQTVTYELLTEIGLMYSVIHLKIMDIVCRMRY